MIFEQESSFVKQILLYIENRQYDMAVELSEEFIEQHPKALISHYLLAKSYHKVEEHQVALKEAHKAFNLAESREDIIALGVFLACSYYEIRRYEKGYEILKNLRDFNDPRIEKAMFILSLCTNDPTTALMHIDSLYEINKRVADRFVTRFVSLANQT